jgi:hypothetical protein
VNIQLSAAVVAYFKNRGMASDDERAAALSPLVSSSDLPVVKAKIAGLVKETFNIGAKYSGLEFLRAMSATARDLRDVHPELTEDAIDSLAWYWSYCNR